MGLAMSKYYGTRISYGAILGYTIGCLAFVVIVGLGIYCLCKRKEKVYEG